MKTLLLVIVFLFPSMLVAGTPTFAKATDVIKSPEDLRIGTVVCAYMTFRNAFANCAILRQTSESCTVTEDVNYCEFWDTPTANEMDTALESHQVLLLDTTIHTTYPLYIRIFRVPYLWLQSLFQ